MKELFDQVSGKTSHLTTHAYSTSFSLGIRFLGKSIRQPLYNIYGFVRFADEIVDSFQGYDQHTLFNEFREETKKAISRGISLNPVLNSFQKVVHEYSIPFELIDSFLTSMETDLVRSVHTEDSYNEYIFGSAEVVGLMCLCVFTKGDMELYEELKPYAMKLGSAFQKVNFLRDIQSDSTLLGRTYFPGIDVSSMSEEVKKKIETEIEQEFAIALKGIRKLPGDAGAGVYLAYVYYRALFSKIKSKPAHRITRERIRIPNEKKLALMVTSMLRYNLRVL